MKYWEGHVPSLILIPMLSQKISKSILTLFVILMAIGYGCMPERGEIPTPEGRPVSSLWIDSIGRTDSSSSKIRLKWTGTASDGWVKGFRIFWSLSPVSNPEGELNNIQQLTSRFDSTFSFNLIGTLGGSVHFYLQSVDNFGRVSIPSYLKINLKNSVPRVTIAASGLPRNPEVFSVFSVPFVLSDLDGNETIDSVFIKANNGNWVPFDVESNLITIVPTEPKRNSTQAQSGFLYSSKEQPTFSTKLETARLNGLVVGDSNQIYIRCKDLAGAFSNIDSLRNRIFIRRQTSDLLLVDTWDIPNATINADNVNEALAAQVSADGFDKLDLLGFNGSYQPTQPRIWLTSFYHTLALYKKVFWYSDFNNSRVNNQTDNGSTLLMTASQALINYLNVANGKLLISARNYIIPDGTPTTKSYPPGSLITRLLSIDTIFNNDLQVRIAGNRDLALSSSAASLNYPVLRTSEAITGFMPFRGRTDATELYSAPMIFQSRVYNNNLVAIKRQNPLFGRTNLVFFGLDFHIFNGNPTAQRECLAKILNEEFNW